MHGHGEAGEESQVARGCVAQEEEEGEEGENRDLKGKRIRIGDLLFKVSSHFGASFGALAGYWNEDEEHIRISKCVDLKCGSTCER